MIAIVLGTRPEIVKLYPLILLLKKKRINFKVIHTGQHYSKNLNDIFFDNFKEFRIDFNLKVGSHSNSKQTALMMTGIEKILLRHKFKALIVYGDTNSSLAGAMVASKFRNITLVHLEAGLRSFETKMPEETNRVLIDHISDLLLTPTKLASSFLIKENIKKEKILFVGNLIKDTLKQVQNKIGTNQILKRLKLFSNKYFLVTIHREENLKQLSRLKWILNSLNETYDYFKLPIIFSCHPHTLKIIKKNKFKINENITLLQSLNYFDFLSLLKNSKLIISDSGGIQEESCILKKRMITIRSNTERQETLKIGCNTLVQHDEQIVNSIKRQLKRKIVWSNPYGSGNVSKKIIKVLKKIR